MLKFLMLWYADAYIYQNTFLKSFCMKTKIIPALIFSLSFTYYTSVAQLKTITYSEGGQKLNGLAGTPTGKKVRKSGVLILPAWMGIDENAKNSATRLTALGYYTFVADIYGDGKYPTDMSSASKISSYYKNNVSEYRNRIKAALDQLIKNGANPNDIVVIGYCFGGTGALEAARANLNVKGVVSFHGGLGRDTTRSIDPISPKVLVCHGANDFFVPEQQVKSFQDEMRKAGADWQMIYYANAVHSFTDPNAGNDPKKGVAYNEMAAKRSWRAMLDFFDEALK